SAAKKAPATKAPAKKASAVTAPARTAKKTAKKALVVREDESPWTAKELREVRAEIEANIALLRTELAHAESELSDLLRDSGDGAGDDQADAGAKTYEREQEIALADNAREMLHQNEHALERLDDGTYGVCESCGQPIGKLRLQAAPRATLCMRCKTKQERR
ncbi:DNA-binding protein, partial [Knoellia flava TL1]